MVTSMTTPFRELAGCDPEAAKRKLLAVFKRARGYTDVAARELEITRQHLGRLVKLLGASDEVRAVRDAARSRRLRETGSKIARPKRRRAKQKPQAPAESFRGIRRAKEGDD